MEKESADHVFAELHSRLPHTSASAGVHIPWIVEIASRGPDWTRASPERLACSWSRWLTGSWKPRTFQEKHGKNMEKIWKNNITSASLAIGTSSIGFIDKFASSPRTPGLRFIWLWHHDPFAELISFTALATSCETCETHGSQKSQTCYPWEASFCEFMG